MDNIIFKINFILLGDELHMIRMALLDLLYNNMINNKVLIYCKKDRSFLYENIFQNIYFIEDYTIENLKNYLKETFNKEYTVINICWELIKWPFSEYNYEQLISTNYNITNRNIFNYKK